MKQNIDLEQRLKHHKLFASIDSGQLRQIISRSQLAYSGPDQLIPIRENNGNMLVLLDGEIKIQKASQAGKTSLLIADTPVPAVLNCVAHDTRITTMGDCRWIWLDSGIIDASLAWREIVYSRPAVKTDQSRHIPLITQTNAFRKLTLDCVAEAFSRMQRIDVGKGRDIVREGDLGDAYYLLDSGSADVLQTDTGDGKPHLVRKLKAGDGFGEESLIQKQSRNATVKMTSDGTVLKLAAHDFSELVQPSLIESISPQDAHAILTQSRIQLVDCRYDFEYEQLRLPGAILVPLHNLRNNVNRFSKDTLHLVYCDKERRSQAAVFLLQERGIKAKYIEGGIGNWPYRIDHNELKMSD